MAGQALSAPQLSGQRFLVYGLARTGLATVGFLLRSGAHVVAWDGKESARSLAAGSYPSIHLADPDSFDLGGLDAVIVSPGVPLNRHPLPVRAKAAGVPVLGDIELFQIARACLPAHRVVGITGTNGKSTTTALTHHLLAHAGIPSLAGGNIGLPILGQPPLPEGGVYVLELSSYQIDLVETLAVDVAVHTNLSPDHLDRYDGMAAYAASKERLFALQPPGAVAVIATDDSWTQQAASNVPGTSTLVRVSATDVDATAQSHWPALQGPHNAQNVACAVAAVRALGLSDEAIEAGLRSFPGLSHRMQIVGEVAGVRYVNDSKATNPTSAAPALQAFSHVHWIVGGQAKTAELDACMPHLGHVKAAYVIGEAADLFHTLLEGRVPVTRSGSVDQAVRDAALNAATGDTVLLSPACASFDQFSDFEARGDAFVEAVKGLCS